jgi:hypothetical protein
MTALSESDRKLMRVVRPTLTRSAHITIGNLPRPMRSRNLLLVSEDKPKGWYASSLYTPLAQFPWNDSVRVDLIQLFEYLSSTRHYLDRCGSERSSAGGAGWNGRRVRTLKTQYAPITPTIMIIALFTLAAVLLAVEGARRLRQRKSSARSTPLPLPPGPKPLHFIGNVLGINIGAPHLTYTEWSKTYGTSPHVY